MPICKDCGKEVPKEEYFIDACYDCASKTLAKIEKNVKYSKGGDY